MKFPTFPTIIDDCLKFTITDLKRSGFFVPNAIRSGVARWNEGRSSICIVVNNIKMVMSLDYIFDGDKHMSYNIAIIERAANIGKGVVRFFVCPSCHLPCRNLYLYGGYFVSRRAMSGALYKTQVESKAARVWRHLFDDKERKYGKEYYRGKLTPYGKRLRIQEEYWHRFDNALSLLSQ